MFEGDCFFIIKDKYPVSDGHLLIVSKAERVDFFDLSEEEQRTFPQLILKAKELIEQNYSPEGYNIGMNCGVVAGQTVMHFHCDVIPRYIGDMEKPQGGIRHCIRGRGYYDTSSK